MKGVFRSASTRLVFISALLVGLFILSGSSLPLLDMEVGAATLEVTDLNLKKVGDAGWVEVKLGSVPDGISGYKLQVSLERTSVGEITDHEFIAFNGASSVSPLPSDSVTFFAADMNKNVQPGNGTTTLARLKLKAQESDSSTSITVLIDKMDDDSGYAMSPSINGGTLKVGSEDTNPPNPDPMSFSTNPHATGSSTIEMQAANASDPEGNGVEYKFRETTGNSGGSDSGWQNSKSYTDSGLDSDTRYCYQVKASDKSSNENKTGWSNERCDRTPREVPNSPSNLNANATSTSRINLNWSDNSNNENGFRIYRDGSEEDTVGSNTESYSDTGLDSDTEYCYRVSAYNSAGESSKTSQDCATTNKQEDTNPPNPDPMYFSTNPHATGSSTIEMQAANASDPEGNGVEYYFKETTGNSGGNNSNWQDSTTYTDSGLESGTDYCYRVKARDKSSNQNYTSWSTEKCATTSLRTITVTQPNGGETWKVGNSHTIKWNSTNAGGTVRIQLSIDGGGSWNNITSSTNNDGSYSWTPNTTSNNCLVKVSSTSYSVSDRSDNTFTISKEDTNPPELVTDFNASDGENSQSTLTWTNPSDGDLAEVVVLRKAGSFPNNHGDGTSVYRNSSPNSGNSITKTDKDLTNGETYYYAVFSRDTNGNWNDNVSEGKNADKGKPTGTGTGIDLQVYNQANNPAENAYVSVLKRNKSGDDVNWIEGGRTDKNGQIHLEVQSGTYILLVSSSSDHFMLRKKNVTAPGDLVMNTEGTVRVNFHVGDVNGNPLSNSVVGVNYEWVDNSVGATNSQGDLTAYITPLNCDLFTYSFNKGYLLIKDNVSLDSDRQVNFKAANMDIGSVSLDVKGFPQDRPYFVSLREEEFRVSGMTRVSQGESFFISAGSYYARVDLQKDDDQGYSWEYWCELGSHEVHVGDNLSFSAGGTFTISTTPNKNKYNPGETLKLTNLVEDEFGHKISWINKYKYTDSSSMNRVDERWVSSGPQRVSPNGSKPWQLDEGFQPSQPMDYVHEYIYPHLIVKNPSEKTIFELQNRDLWWGPYENTIPDDAEEGFYTAQLILNTGPHQGTIQDKSEFTVGKGGGTPSVFRIDKQGNVYADKAFHGEDFVSGNADLAETVEVTEPAESGDVLSLDPAKPEQYKKCSKPYSNLAAGVVSTEPGVTLGTSEQQNQATIALMGTVPVKATTENGPINLGDLLTTSSKPGYAMVCKDKSKCAGAIIGKALGALEEGEGKIRMLVVS